MTDREKLVDDMGQTFGFVKRDHVRGDSYYDWRGTRVDPRDLLTQNTNKSSAGNGLQIVIMIIFGIGMFIYQELSQFFTWISHLFGG